MIFMSLCSESLPRCGQKPGFSPLFFLHSLESTYSHAFHKSLLLLLLLSHSVVSDSLWPRGLQHSRLPCPSLSPRVCSNSCSLMLSKHLTLHYPLLPLPSIFPSIRVFSSESTLCIRWPKYWSFICSISPSNEYSGLISFRTDWFDLLGA